MTQVAGKTTGRRCCGGFGKQTVDTFSFRPRRWSIYACAMPPGSCGSTPRHAWRCQASL